jgi:hypothetical protein
MNADSLRPRPASQLTRGQALVSPTYGLRSIANTENITTNTSNTGQLQQPDSTETGSDQRVVQTGGGPLRGSRPVTAVNSPRA